MKFFAPLVVGVVAFLSSQVDANGVCYDPNHVSTMSASSVQADMQTIASHGFDSVRTYISKFGNTEMGPIIAAAGLKAMLGVPYPQSDYKEQMEAAIKAAKAGGVYAIMVGNENLAGASSVPGDMISVIQQIKSQVPSGVLVGTVQRNTEVINHESVSGWSDLVSNCDLVGVNAHPFFTPHTAAENAIQVLNSQWQTMTFTIGSKLILTETGWPSSGSLLGNVGTVEAAQTFYNAYQQWSSSMAEKFYFQMFDVPSKSEDFEKTFGLVTSESQDKFGMSVQVSVSIGQTNQQQQQAPTTGAPQQQQQTPATDAPQQQQQQTPATDAPQQQQQQQQTPATDAPQQQQQQTPATDAPQQQQQTPATDAPQQQEQTPATDAPQQQQQQTPATEAPATEAPTQQQTTVTDAPTQVPTLPPTEATPAPTPAATPVPTETPAIYQSSGSADHNTTSGSNEVQFTSASASASYSGEEAGIVSGSMTSSKSSKTSDNEKQQEQQQTTSTGGETEQQQSEQTTQQTADTNAQTQKQDDTQQANTQSSGSGATTGVALGVGGGACAALVAFGFIYQARKRGADLEVGGKHDNLITPMDNRCAL
ncbi:unnamed protein product [Phytophthora fragariaefolia]|uniref:glucan endo-1,3-beta-D-glucosidase n=1 Tax=Phytophthora fragariaefolia TaxID=1490495 RepID=A0A9W6UCP1_9STRA|nr:unnamed protein product [Phytophthora fragariaefolia]